MTVLADITARALKAANHADAETLDTAGRHVLDTVACVISGATHPLTRRWLPLVPPGPPDGSSALGVRGRWHEGTAVEIEATLAHVDEFDPLHGGAAVAPGAVVTPAALLTAAKKGLSGGHVARAIVGGYEAAIDAATRFGGPALYSTGWWPTALFGSLGSAAATAMLLDLDPATATTALALAAAPAGGLFSTDLLGDAHYLLCGRAAAHGHWSAHAAAAGLTASTSLLDGPISAALGRSAGGPTSFDRPHIETTSIKQWPCAKPLHTALTALDELEKSGLALHPGDSVRIALPTAALRFVTDDRHPASPVEAAASATVVVAGTVAHRAQDPTWYRDIASGQATMPDIAVTIAADPDLDVLLPAHWGAEVTVHSGRQTHQRRVLIAPGDPDRAMTNEAVLGKAAPITNTTVYDQTLQRLLHLSSESDVRALRAAVISASVPNGDNERKITPQTE